MNLKRELQKMSITDLKAVCRDLSVSCSKSKRGIVKRLLEPLKRGYKLHNENAAGPNGNAAGPNDAAGPNRNTANLGSTDGTGSTGSRRRHRRAFGNFNELGM